MDQDRCIEDDDDFMMGAETRSRCYTWPVRQFSLSNGASGQYGDSQQSSEVSTPLSDSQYSLSQHAPPELYQNSMMSKFSSVSDSSTFQRLVVPNNLTSQQHQFTFQLPCNSTSIMNGTPGRCLTSYLQHKSSAPPPLPSPAMSNGQHIQQLKLSPPATFCGQNPMTSSTDQYIFKQELVDEIREHDVTATGGHPPDLHTDSQQSTPQEKPKRVRRKNNTADQLSHKKPNPWGEDSYSDLIARALCSAIDGRLKLNEIYQWFSDNIPYFAERSSQEEAQGWKNSIRHNLSLHSRFMRIQNEGAGKSSWWVINPDAKPGRNPRRRANTMESSSKINMDKRKRPGAGSNSRKSSLRGIASSAIHSASTSIMGSQYSVVSPQEGYGLDVDEPIGLGTGNANFDTFRPRTQSTLSIPCSSSRLSPTQEPPGFEDFDFPSWMDGKTQQQNANGGNNQQVKEILDRTDRIQLEGERIRRMNGIKLEPLNTSPPHSSSIVPPNIVPLPAVTKSECMELNIVKQEPIQIQPPPSYQDLERVCRPSQLQNPLLCQLTMGRGAQNANGQLAKLIHNGLNGGQFYPLNPGPIFGPPGSSPQQPGLVMAVGGPPNATSPPQWATQIANGQLSGQSQFLQQVSLGQLRSSPQPGGGTGGTFGMGGLPLPQDLENLDQSLVTDLDMEAVLRHELSQSQGHQLQFDLP